MRRPRFTACFGIVLAAASCVNYTSLDPADSDSGLAPPAEAGAIVPPAADDAAASWDALPDAAEDAADSRTETVCPLPNLLTNGSFEEGLIGWRFNGVPSVVSVAHTGARALQLCPEPGNQAAFAGQDLDETGFTVPRARVWLRSAPGLPAPTSATLACTLPTFERDIEPVLTSITETWSCAEALFEAGSYIGFLVTQYDQRMPPDGACMLVDDAELFATDGGAIPEACRCPLP